MKLTSEQTNQVLTRLNEFRDSRKPCSICGNNSWVIGDTIFEVREFNNGDLVVGEQSAVMPVLAISCSHCGHTKFISAIKMGIIQPSVSSNTADSNANPND